MCDHGAFVVYALQLSNGHFYVGQTNNLQRRIHEHLRGRTPYTRKFKIKKIVYTEYLATRSEALKREKFLKSGQGRQWLHNLLAEQSALADLSAFGG
ncbi:MAG: GIY-YIG nuclease superfamily protein [bacterium ADurb.Bin478]|nr:MAG: GIY-YIG nuclease superfamily protein [bacterium ADurb.Bin478]